MLSPKPCPFCGQAVQWREIADPRSAEMVGPWRRLGCDNKECAVRPFVIYNPDHWEQGKGTRRIDRDAEFLAAWNTRQV